MFLGPVLATCSRYLLGAAACSIAVEGIKKFKDYVLEQGQKPSVGHWRERYGQQKAPLHRRVNAPAPALAPRPEELVPISDLDDWMQECFPGYRTLNLVQSKVFPTLFGSTENVLFCAPTGCGKTDVAMLSVLKVISQNRVNGEILKYNFKIVYVAPLKALATEVVQKFSQRLRPLGLIVREHTGDSHLNASELAEAQMIVVTPEKYDGMTRKGGLDSFASQVKLLIFDEVQILHDDRGHVVEALVARTLRQVEAGKQDTRIVGLSATLPNYEDVAKFMNVQASGLFFFGSKYRPVPLAIEVFDVLSCGWRMMDDICYKKVADTLRRGKQALIFVHRKIGTVQTAEGLLRLAEKWHSLPLFDNSRHPLHGEFKEGVGQSRSPQLKCLFEKSVGIHHAGMDREDKSLTEEMFSQGLLKVIVSTATLAWGVNLPAQTVIIKGTEVWDDEAKKNIDLDMLNVHQMFGRAGRPQFDSSGEAVLVTEQGKFDYYLNMLVAQMPIESKFRAMLLDHLNAEIVLGNVSSLTEACSWLKYTYLYARIQRDPKKYHISMEDAPKLGLTKDQFMDMYFQGLVSGALEELSSAQMVVCNDGFDNIFSKPLGQLASHRYIRYQSMVTYLRLIKLKMEEADVYSMVAQSSEFDSIRDRGQNQVEQIELIQLARACDYKEINGINKRHEKIVILLMALCNISHHGTSSPIFAQNQLKSDQVYVEKNAKRIFAALEEIALMQGYSQAARMCMSLHKRLERKMWCGYQVLAQTFFTMMVPTLHALTHTTLKLRLILRPKLEACEMHGEGTRWLILLEDATGQRSLFSASWLLTKEKARKGDQPLDYNVHIPEPMPRFQCRVRLVCKDRLDAKDLRDEGQVSSLLTIPSQ